jgi:tRNA threonylcarbamoyl adenosine modification protein YjeE
VKLADAAQTVRAGERLAAIVRGGDAIALIGDLGAGKTTLVTGLVAALGGGAAASPTFSLVNEYPGGRLIVWHVDLYRIEREAELVELGLDDVIGDPRGICVVEWADRFAVLPPITCGSSSATIRAAGGRSRPPGRGRAAASSPSW